MGQADTARTILIVEDEVFIRHDLMDFFEDRGFVVFEAEDADHAIAVLEANPIIQIVLTDIQMPGSMDGLRLAHYVRDRYPPTVLVIASGAVKVTDSDLPDRAMFVAKPFDPRFILRQIERLSSS
ncbi:response regulator [Agrobacterium larrymoorei]|uniref:Response regulator n=1 Tax=Agrobacterium larrymoorei TaxID=160699 RepID=A0A4D7E5Q5_9HYPH|nr:response regulator [Agrobacterium larrymoorei]QCJ00581.1 response regulator [Agrobacterium larrymoorei]QYA10578.1 response regulator [Agrobacterium larrymoorei]